MTKATLRKIYTDKRKQLSHTQKEKLDDLILIQFQKLSLPPFNTVLSFWPMVDRNETDTHTIIDFILFRNPGVHIAYPVIHFASNRMKAIRANDDTEFKVNEYSIWEPVSGDELSPEDIDIVLIPLLAFDKNGFRVGYGKGFYDRYLSGCKKDILKIGLSYFDPVDLIEDIDKTDIAMDFCITPEYIYQFPVSLV
ncbi:MAG: 5-formyltetrahydrofolate cyclo-ligase [Ferruginibacter sp.]